MRQQWTGWRSAPADSHRGFAGERDASLLMVQRKRCIGGVDGCGLVRWTRCPGGGGGVQGSCTTTRSDIVRDHFRTPRRKGRVCPQRRGIILLGNDAQLLGQQGQRQPESVQVTRRRGEEIVGGSVGHMLRHRRRRCSCRTMHPKEPRRFFHFLPRQRLQYRGGLAAIHDQFTRQIPST